MFRYPCLSRHVFRFTSRFQLFQHPDDLRLCVPALRHTRFPFRSLKSYSALCGKRGAGQGEELFHMLEQKNGFYAFEYALHVFPLTSDPETGLEGWNAESLWRNEYQDLADGL